MDKNIKRSKYKSSRKTVNEELLEIDQMSNFIKDKVLNHQFKINTKFKSRKQKLMYDTIMQSRITIVKGSAGCGKTLVALMAGLECIKDKSKNISQIILTKPIVEISSSRGLGALPGLASEKTAPYYAHFYDNLVKIIGSQATKYLCENEVIKETILNYLRGSTFGKYDSNGNPIGSFAIFDESQNSTRTEMLTFISRMGENSKLIILGDSDQIDLRLNKNEKCGLDDAFDRLQGIIGIGHIEFTEDDIVRDPFLIEILKRYKGYMND